MAYLFNPLFAVHLLLLAATGATSPLKRLHSSQDSKISLSFKETHVCETTPGVKSYAGYVDIPAAPSEGRDFDVHTFFWFFEARNDPANAPLSLWLQGGPGVPSVTAALGENGPCRVAADSKGTVLNPWSWNNHANILYIDQPVQVGFSYDTLVKGAINETDSPFNVILDEDINSKIDATFLSGTFSSQSINSTVHTTPTAALAAWHFMQTWMKEFPVYKPKRNAFSIWSESYGGHYGPTFASFFENQNELINNGSMDDCTIKLNVETVGIVNGCIDSLTQMPAYPQMANNNTYGLKTLSDKDYQAAVDAFSTCRELVETCQSLAYRKDPSGRGEDLEVNNACKKAFGYCYTSMAGPYEKSGRNVFDITAKLPDPFPPKYAAGFLNSKEVQEDLGVPLNFTGLSTAVQNGFTGTGDFLLGRNLAILGNLLDKGIKVALVYGDRDFQCNWFGGENISLAIQSKTSPDFHKAGYAEIKTNDTYVGGMVRQHENLSFSRVFNAGHEVPWYQPETAYQIFNRVMSDTDVATGTFSTSSGGNYKTTGAASVDDLKSEMPAAPEPECYFWDILETCLPEQTEMIQNGTAIMKDFIMIGHELEDGSAYYYSSGP